MRRPAGLSASGFALLLSLLWGGNQTSIKVSLEYGAPLQVGWMRFVLGGIVTVIYTIAIREPIRLARTEIRPVLIIGLLFSVQIVFTNVGQNLTTAGHATALNTTFPIWAAVMAQFLIPSDRLNRWKVIAIVLSYGGVLAVVFGDTGASAEGVTIRGDVFSLISAVLLALRMILISNFAQNMSEAKLMLGQLSIGTVTFLVGSYLFETVEYPLDGRFILALAYQGLIIAGFGFLGNAWLVKKYLPSTITFFYFVQPVAGVALAWMILGEDPGQGLIAGLILVSLGALIFGGESYIKARRQTQSSLAAN